MHMWKYLIRQKYYCNNNTGANTEPCGTPLGTNYRFEATEDHLFLYKLSKKSAPTLWN